ncbi:hypothetical protein MPL3365_170124 [Mesorhizobium plurifarium]|uniref:Uncharacterized protein n=1 Tax=Mesorhizobium plurifarium TaxID=69974 RepID=A0A090FZ65_MESPL|nr:hypothetical protein MPL3365_170124 [Mesorhizobium plurifarium]
MASVARVWKRGLSLISRIGTRSYWLTGDPAIGLVIGFKELRRYNLSVNRGLRRFKGVSRRRDHRIRFAPRTTSSSPLFPSARSAYPSRDCD